jgi:hypothetical protein
VPPQQTQGVQIKGRDAEDFATLSVSGTKVALDVNLLGALIPSDYDYIAITYVAAGNGVGKMSTVTYKTGGSSGTTVAILTLTYNSDNKMETVTRT